MAKPRAQLSRIGCACRFVLAVLAPLAVVVACRDETASREATPVLDAGLARECRGDPCTPYACDTRHGHCFTVCRATEDCERGFVCDRGACIGTDCTPETADRVCGGYACAGGACVRDCTTASCTSGFYCRGDTKACVRRCTRRDDPSCAGYVCDVTVGECEPYCLAGETECAEGYVCTPAMQCIPSTDAG